MIRHYCDGTVARYLPVSTNVLCETPQNVPHDLEVQDCVVFQWHGNGLDGVANMPQLYVRAA
jgi:hypothetical protein